MKKDIQFKMAKRITKAVLQKQVLDLEAQVRELVLRPDSMESLEIKIKVTWWSDFEKMVWFSRIPMEVQSPQSTSF